MRKKLIPIVFLLIAITSIYVVFRSMNHNELRVSFLDVGQGDAIFIQSPSGIQVLVDGGKDRSVVEELHKVMPLFDKKIDMVVATHPDADHIGGLIDVLKIFDVEVFLESGGQNENSAQDTLESKLKEKNIKRKITSRGEEYDLGKGVYITTLYPYYDVSNTESNTGSLIMQLSYGEHIFLLTGDAPVESELNLIGSDNGRLQSTVLKFGHHGSDTSTSYSFLEKVRPTYGVVSAGKNNQYGHPHTDVLDRASRFNVDVLQTSELGTITFSTNGKEIKVLNLPEDFQVRKLE